MTIENGLATNYNNMTDEGINRLKLEITML